MGNQSRGDDGRCGGQVRRVFEVARRQTRDLLQGAAPGQRSGEDTLVQRRGRSHGRGIPDGALKPIARSTPVWRQGQPQTKIRTCGQIRGSENDHRRLKAPPLPLHDHRFDNLERNAWRGRDVAPPGLDRGHQSAGRRRTPTSLGCARPRKARGGPSQGSPGVPRKHPGASRRSISLACKGEGKKGKGDARRPKNEVSGRRSVG